MAQSFFPKLYQHFDIANLYFREASANAISDHEIAKSHQMLGVTFRLLSEFDQAKTALLTASYAAAATKDDTLLGNTAFQYLKRRRQGK